MAPARKASAPKTVEVILSDPKAKKSVTRFDASDDGAALSNAYISNDALKALGNPDSVKITIEPA